MYSQKKCEQYWPSQGKNTYGDITVETLDIAEYTDYTIRTFRITEVSRLSSINISEYMYNTVRTLQNR